MRKALELANELPGKGYTLLPPSESTDGKSTYKIHKLPGPTFVKNFLEDENGSIKITDVLEETYEKKEVDIMDTGKKPSKVNAFLLGGLALLGMFTSVAYALNKTSQKYDLSLKQSAKYYASKLFPSKFEKDGIPYHEKVDTAYCLVKTANGKNSRETK